MIDNPISISAGGAETAAGTYRNTSAASVTIYDRTGKHTMAAMGSLAESVMLGDLVVVIFSSTQQVSGLGAISIYNSASGTSRIAIYQVTGDGFSITISISGGTIIS